MMICAKWTPRPTASASGNRIKGSLVAEEKGFKRLSWLLRCRIIKLLSRKRRHLVVFCISFYWPRGICPEKRRDCYLKKSPSSGILHQWTCKQMFWLRLNCEDPARSWENLNFCFPSMFLKSFWLYLIAKYQFNLPMLKANPQLK